MKISKRSYDFIEDVYSKLKAETKAIIARSAVFLALQEGIPPNFRPADSKGVDMDDDTILRELKDVVRASLNYKSKRSLDESEYREQLRHHFEFGCQRLEQIWEDNHKDQSKFLGALLKLSPLLESVGSIGSGGSKVLSKTEDVVSHAVKIKLLRDEPEWFVNEAGGNGLLLISGRPGLGKTQLALDLLAQLSLQGVRFVFFDLKGELEDSADNLTQKKTRDEFFNVTGAEYVRLVERGLPINPLIKGASDAENSIVAGEVISLIRAFGPQLGQVQANVLQSAYQRLENPDFASLLEELQRAGEEGVAYAMIKRINDVNLFASTSEAIPAERWLGRSQVIDFKKFGADGQTKSLAVVFILNLLMRELNRQLPVQNGVQPLRAVLFVDEAHLILPEEGKAGLLASLARQGRSWGFPLWLASQDADKFVTTGVNPTNFADQSECGVHFSPETLSTEALQRKILGQSLTRQPGKGEAVLRRKSKLAVGKTRQFYLDHGK